MVIPLRQMLLLLADEFHKTIIKKIQKCELYSSFVDNNRRNDIRDTQLISKYNKGFCFQLRIIDIFNKYVQNFPLKVKYDEMIAKEFSKISNKSFCKPNKTLVRKGSWFYNRSIKLWLESNNSEIYSTQQFI